MKTDFKRACGLVRVSSDEQAKSGYGLKFQEQDIKEFCKRQSLNLIKTFRDEGFSGATAERPGLKEMLEWARERRFEVLVVWKLDRLFRDVRLTLQTIDELAALDIEFRSVQETFTHDSNGRFLLTIFAAGAEKERKDITLRMYSGRMASAAAGTYINGGAPPYGYRYNRKTKRLVIEPDEALVVRQIFSWLIDERLSTGKIQSRLNEERVPTKFDRLRRKKPTGTKCWWNKRTIGRILTNEVYTGRFTFRKYWNLGRVKTETNLRPQKDWIEVKTPVIVSRHKFLRAQEQLRINSENSPRKTRVLYLLRGLLVCGHDGRRMQAARRRHDRWRECKYYFCSAIRKSHSAKLCPSKSVSESRLVQPVWKMLSELLSNPHDVLEHLSEYQQKKTGAAEVSKQLSLLESRRQKAIIRKSRIVELYLGQAVDKPYFLSENHRLQDELKQIKQAESQLRRVIPTREQINATESVITELYATYKAKLQKASPEVQREILQLFVKKIVIRGEELDIDVALPQSGTLRDNPRMDCPAKDSLKPSVSEDKSSLSLTLRATLVPVKEMLATRKRAA